jgi:glycosyltransferase involved in cell wall biosynthesis
MDGRNMLDRITPLILTFNEAPNIDRTLHCLTWAKHIVVVDSYSTDETLAILQSYTQVQIVQRTFDSFARQCNYGLQYVESNWVLSIDADYIVTDELIAQMEELDSDSPMDGYFTRFKYCVFGKPLRGTLLPPRQVLFQREKATYIDDGHAHQVNVNGKSGMLSGYIYHDDRKPFSRWLSAQDRYMVLEAKKLIEIPNKDLSFADRIRKTKILAPGIILFYCLILKGGILDGWRGWYYALQRTIAEMILSIRLIEFECSRHNIK